MFNPTVLQPEPAPWFVRELKVIDPNLRVVFGYERYLKNTWVIERRVSPERYNAMYASLFRDGGQRFVDQPIYDDSKPIVDELGNETGAFEIIGYRKFDLAPEWEWIANIQTPEGKFKPLSHDDLIDLRRQYAWNYTHAYSRARFEKEEQDKKEAKEKADKNKRMELWMESYDQSLLEHGHRVTAKPYLQSAAGDNA